MDTAGLIDLPVGDPDAMRRKARQLRSRAARVNEVAIALDHRVQVTPYAGHRAEAFRARMVGRRLEAARIADDIRHAAWLLLQSADRVEAARRCLLQELGLGAPL